MYAAVSPELAGRSGIYLTDCKEVGTPITGARAQKPQHICTVPRAQVQQHPAIASTLLMPPYEYTL